MRRITLALIIGIVLVVLFIIIAFLFLVLAKPKYGKQDLDNPLANVSNESEIVIGEVHINYILNDIGAYQLHTGPGSNENPLIEVRVDNSVFYSEIINGNITTRREKTYEPDLKIVTTKQEVINALKADSIKEYMKDSVSSGKTSIELVAGYSELFFKGYLSMYQEMTGKSFTGAVIRIFRQG